MAYPKNKEEYFDRAKEILEKNGFTVNPYRTIQYGLQFIFFINDSSGIIRVFEGKKGIKLDLSQVKEEALLDKVQKLFSPIELENGKLLKFGSSKVKEQGSQPVFENDDIKAPKKDPDEIVGIDESGKGDYFGPLVIAAVYTNATISEKLRELGVQDSKKIPDKRIREMAPKIKELTTHSIVEMANKSYNEIYEKVQNLNHVLSWAHAQVLDNVLEQVDCPYALSDQFGNPQLIRAKLYSLGKNVTLFSRPRAEDNVAVAAASILARDMFLDYLDEIKQQTGHNIPKGAGPKVIQTAQTLIDEFGPDILPFVTKLHFKTTDQLTFPEAEKKEDKEEEPK